MTSQRSRKKESKQKNARFSEEPDLGGSAWGDSSRGSPSGRGANQGHQPLKNATSGWTQEEDQLVDIEDAQISEVYDINVDS